MRLSRLCLIFTALTVGLYAQRSGGANPQPRTVGGFGSVVYPGGQPGFGSVLFPGGGGVRTIVPGSASSLPLHGGAVLPSRVPVNPVYGRGVGRGITPIVAYPIYVGGYDPYSSAAQQEQQAPAQQYITVVYPPQQPAPMIVYQVPAGETSPEAASAPQSDSNLRSYRAPSNEPATQRAQPEGEDITYYLAFKDRTVYPAVAYYVEGDTLHYFTAGNQHNQVSVSLVDRDMTERLNRRSGVSVKLP
jgi:hypothetical protein